MPTARVLLQQGNGTWPQTEAQVTLSIYLKNITVGMCSAGLIPYTLSHTVVVGDGLLLLTPCCCAT
jgi:hypothetical protein